MAIKIEEAFNDCFERLTLGESLDSCLRRFPEHAVELDLMLRTAYDVKRRVYPIQPRPEFKYWSRVRLQGVQDYMTRQPAPGKASPFNFRKGLAISMAGLLVLVIASSGTAAASYEALPDQPLYGVKMAVEQAQLTLAVSDVDKGEVYANLAEKRAHEIEAMALQGKADYLISATTRMNYQLDQAESYITKYQTANAAVPAAATDSLPAGTSAEDVPDQTVQAVPAPTTLVKPLFVAPDVKTGTGERAIKGPLPPLRGAVNVNRAKTTLNSSTAKSLTALQVALDKAPESARPAIIKSIERVKKANEWSQHKMNEEQDREDKPETVIPRPNTLPLKPLPDGVKPNRDNEGHIITPDKPKYIPPLNNNLANPATETVKPPVTVPNTQIQLPVTPVIPRTLDTGSIQAPVINNNAGTVISPETRGDSSYSPATKVFSR
jgi:hypothetical protein